MKQKLAILSLLTFLALTECKKDIQQTEQNLSKEAISAKPPAAGNTTVNLRVTVDDGSPNLIQSDDKGDYINGTDKVQAQIMSTGDFYMNTNTNTAKQPVRTMHFPFGGPELALEGKRNYSLRTTTPATPLQNMAVGEAGTQLVGFRVWAAEQSGQFVWKLLFRMGIEDNPSSLTDYAKVTRLPGDVWTIEPAGYSATPANAMLADGASPANPIGHYVMPFKLILTKTGR
jgi:hypothetical protein